MTKFQKKEWKNYCVEILRKEYGYTKRGAERAFMWIDLMYGFSES
jgi:hypothetical protein